MMAGGLAGSRACDGTDTVSNVCPLLIRGFGFESLAAHPGSPVTPHCKVSLKVQDGSVTLCDGKPRESACSPADMDGYGGLPTSHSIRAYLAVLYRL
jgi:hypothetical protein